jgi:epsilon-lactone hydrolase
MPEASAILRRRGRNAAMLIQVGSDEILRDDATPMAAKLLRAGCEAELEEWPRMPHDWHHYARSSLRDAQL